MYRGGIISRKRVAEASKINIYFTKKMKKPAKNYDFKNLSIKSDTAMRFRKYAASLDATQSACLKIMLDFFESNKISPTEDLGPNMSSLEHSLKKRIDGFIAILRDIEKSQTKPTQAMLAALLEATATPTGASKNHPDVESLLASYEIPVKEESPKTPPVNPDLLLLLENLEFMKPPFSSSYIRLNLTRNELQQLKNKYHVH